MSRPVRLWLFDIDGTLVDTGGAGIRALQEAARASFGDTGPELDLAGSTDLGVLAGMLEHFGVEDHPDRTSAFFATYLERLEWQLREGGFDGRVLPGAIGLLETIAMLEDSVVGLLTGNIEPGALAKMRHFGLDQHFAFGAYGSDHADRNLLGPIALERATAHAGRDFLPEETLVIGDTPKDIACAHAIGARCLAVATGRFSADELKTAGADHVARGLEEVEELVMELAGDGEPAGQRD